MESDSEHLKHLDILRQTGFWGQQGAGCLIFARNTGRFLVPLRSAYCQQPLTYGTIGGAVDSGESPAEAMRREVREECGYAGQIAEVKPLHEFSQQTRAGTTFTYHNFLVVVEDEFETPRHWETEKFVWVTFKELTELTPKHFGLESLLLHSGKVLRSCAEGSRD